MKAAPMAMQIDKPTAVPTHTWSHISLLERLRFFQAREAAYLAHKLLVGCRITVGSKGLFEKSQQHGDNNTGLQSLTKNNEEDYMHSLRSAFEFER